jgi:DNA-directed RNA polymerase specialized sigma24 family protein
VRDAVAFLAAATTRLAINVTQSARARRETHIGTWLPEPVDIEADLAHSAERAEALDRAVLVLLEARVSHRPSRLRAPRSVRPALPADLQSARDQRGK